MKSIIEYIVKAIENTYIVEMAYDRKKYKDVVNSLAYQLYENWCLIRYATLTNHVNVTKSHWQAELMSHIDNICKMSLKLDKESNDNIGYGHDESEGIITTKDSDISVYVLPTNEEVMIVRDTYRLINSC